MSKALLIAPHAPTRLVGLHLLDRRLRHADDQPPHHPQHQRRLGLAHPAAIFIQRDVQRLMQPAFNDPVAAFEMEPARRVAQLTPAADLVSGALVELRIDKALRQGQGMAPALLPIIGKAREHELHEPADEIGIMALGQNQQAGVVGQERQPPAPLLLRPADEGVTRFEVQGGGAPGGQPQPLALVGGDITDVFAHDTGVFEVVMLDDDLVKSLDFMGLDQPHGEVFQDVLLVGGGLAMADFVLLHAGERKQSQATCPAKSINPPCRSDLPAWKSAP